MIRIEVEGRAAPKGSRIAAYTKAGKLYTRPASKHEKPWVDAVKAQTQIVMRHHEMVTPPYAVDLYFYIAPPKRPDRRTRPYPTRADIDKLARAALDGLVNGGALSDDSHVTTLTVRSRWADLHAPGVTATIEHDQLGQSVQLAA